jgi:hypothetical protein
VVIEWNLDLEFLIVFVSLAPFLVPVFEIFSPQLLVALNSLLPIILTTFCQLEGPISGASVESFLVG